MFQFRSRQPAAAFVRAAVVIIPLVRFAGSGSAGEPSAASAADRFSGQHIFMGALGVAVLVSGFRQTFLHAPEQLRLDDRGTVGIFSGTLERPCVSLVGKDSGNGINAELFAAAGSIAGGP